MSKTRRRHTRPSLTRGWVLAGVLALAGLLVTGAGVGSTYALSFFGGTTYPTASVASAGITGFSAALTAAPSGSDASLSWPTATNGNGNGWELSGDDATASGLATSTNFTCGSGESYTPIGSSLALSASASTTETSEQLTFTTTVAGSNLTSGSATVTTTAPGGFSGASIAAGMTVTGTGIAASTTVSSVGGAGVGGSSLVLSASATTTEASEMLTFSVGVSDSNLTSGSTTATTTASGGFAAAGVAAGMAVTGTGIANNTTVSSVGETMVGDSAISYTDTSGIAGVDPGDMYCYEMQNAEGTSFASSETVASVSGTSLTLSEAATANETESVFFGYQISSVNLIAGSTTATTTSANGFAGAGVTAGMTITGSGLGTGTVTVSSVTGSSLTMSSQATATVTGETLVIGSSVSAVKLTSGSTSATATGGFPGVAPGMVAVGTGLPTGASYATVQAGFVADSAVVANGKGGTANTLASPDTFTVTFNQKPSTPSTSYICTYGSPTQTITAPFTTSSDDVTASTGSNFYGVSPGMTVTDQSAGKSAAISTGTTVAKVLSATEIQLSQAPHTSETAAQTLGITGGTSIVLGDSTAKAGNNCLWGSDAYIVGMLTNSTALSNSAEYLATYNVTGDVLTITVSTLEGGKDTTATSQNWTWNWTYPLTTSTASPTLTSATGPATLCTTNPYASDLCTPTATGSF